MRMKYTYEQYVQAHAVRAARDPAEDEPLLSAEEWASKYQAYLVLSAFLNEIVEPLAKQADYLRLDLLLVDLYYGTLNDSE